MPQFEGCDDVKFRVTHGPRNQPAIQWLAKHLGVEADTIEEGLHAIPASLLENFKPVTSVQLMME